MITKSGKGPTPSGAAHWKILYLDEHGNPTDESVATHYVIHEYDERGYLTQETVGFCPEQ